jgi:Ca-activated chloride channel family protein
METLADKGNGNYAYIDNLEEAKKTLVNEFGSTLFTIAKDVKLQIEFNPAKVKAYRLIGYENRLLNDEDFNNDAKDAGEMGAGHSVTALYEIIPADMDDNGSINKVDDLKYQSINANKIAETSNEIANVKIRYKEPKKLSSVKFVYPVVDEVKPLEKCSDTYRFSASVALFGMLLRESEFAENADYSSVIELAMNAKGNDFGNYRSEFIQLVNSVK